MHYFQVEHFLGEGMPSPFSLPAYWNAAVRAGAGAAILVTRWKLCATGERATGAIWIPLSITALEREITCDFV